MQIEQILVRPNANTVIVHYSDTAGRRNNLAFESGGNAKVQSLVDECQQKLPAEENHPAKDEIEQEIAELEYRLAQLKQSIGVS